MWRWRWRWAQSVCGRGTPIGGFNGLSGHDQFIDRVLLLLFVEGFNVPAWLSEVEDDEALVIHSDGY